ncbi:hypothetical protein MUP77_23710, partial [Candidatus Bathyarchaeota archaeon]|nr:hypothetical protein [Candidatus Bathyarchaeota archaeon]
GTEIHNSIVGRHVKILSTDNQRTQISGVSVIGDNVTIGKGCELISTKIFPHKVIPDSRRMVNEILK